MKNQANSELLSFVATAVGMTPSEVSEGIRILKKHEILHAGRRTLPELSDELEEFIFGYDGSDIAQKFSAILEVKNTFPPESFGVPSQDISILKRLLVEKSGTHILFYGKPGVGKTEFAKSLSVALGKKILVPERGKDKKSGLSSVNL